MKKFSTFLILCFLLAGIQKTFAQFPTIYTYINSAGGPWGVSPTANLWETFTGNATNTPGAPGTGSVVTSIPTGTSYLYVRTGQTITMGASKSTMGITIQSGGTLLAGGAFTLSINKGGTGFSVGPLNYGIVNDGILGSTSESMVLDISNLAGNVLITGAGTFNLGRLRIVGGNTNNPVVTIDANLTLNVSGNYALSAMYIGTATDNYILNLNAGKTITLSSASGYINSTPTTSGGNYTYNINGTLDLSASTQTASGLSAFSPTGGNYNLNVGSTGLIKTGAGFNSSPVAPGVANLSIAAGGVVDATLATVFNFNGNAFVTNGTAILKRTVTGDGIRYTFPVKTTAGNLTPVVISRLNTSGTSAVYTASVQNTFDNTPVDATKCVNKQWNLGITGAPSADDTIRLSWVAADNGTNFSPTGTVAMMHYTAGAYEYRAATVTGTGTTADPYVARASGFTSYSPFGITSASVLPLNLLSFTANSFGKTTTLHWVTSNEINVKDFDLQKSEDGISFQSINKTLAQNNSSNYYSYTDGISAKEIIYYRIKMNDADGRFTYSNIIKLRLGQNNRNIKVYPNPVQDLLFVEHNPATKNTVINIFSADGKLIVRKTALPGTVKTAIEVAGLNKGNYTISITDGNSSSASGFIKL